MKSADGILALLLLCGILPLQAFSPILISKLSLKVSKIISQSLVSTCRSNRFLLKNRCSATVRKTQNAAFLREPIDITISHISNQCRLFSPSRGLRRSTVSFLSSTSGEDFVRSQRLDELDEADLLLQTGESYLPLEGDIVEYVDGVGNVAKLGMILEDAEALDGTVRVRELQCREGSGEYDEWLCYARGGAEALATVPVEVVRYCGSCTGLVEPEDDPEDSDE